MPKPLHKMGHARDGDTVSKHLVAFAVTDLFPVMPIFRPKIRIPHEPFAFQRGQAADLEP